MARARGEIDARASAIAAADYLYVRCLVAECSTSRKLGAEEEIEHCALIRVQLPGHTESHADILWEQDTATYSFDPDCAFLVDERVGVGAAGIGMAHLGVPRTAHALAVSGMVPSLLRGNRRCSSAHSARR